MRVARGMDVKFSEARQWTAVDRIVAKRHVHLEPQQVTLCGVGAFAGLIKVTASR